MEEEGKMKEDHEYRYGARVLLFISIFFLLLFYKFPENSSGSPVYGDPTVEIDFISSDLVRPMQY